MATLRQARHTRYPDPLKLYMRQKMAEQMVLPCICVKIAGIFKSVMLKSFKQVLLTRLNLEMAVTDAMVKYAEKIHPAHCCFVPEKRQELTQKAV